MLSASARVTPGLLTGDDAMSSVVRAEIVRRAAGGSGAPKRSDSDVLLLLEASSDVSARGALICCCEEPPVDSCRMRGIRFGGGRGMGLSSAL